MTRIIVHIDRLVLRGVDPAQRNAVAAALQAELARSLARPGAPQRLAASGGRPRIEAGVHGLRAGATPGGIGRAAGRAIAREVGR